MSINLHYREKGSGEVLILIHGNGEDGSYFTSQIEQFSRQYRVIAPDSRGHGRSPRGTGSFTLSALAEDLHDFMITHDIKRAHILGFSDGQISLCFLHLNIPIWWTS